MPEGFKDIKEELPPLWEDVILLTEDNRHILGYYSGHMNGKKEFLTSNEDKLIPNVVGWMPTF